MFQSIEKFLTDKAVAERYSICRETVWRWSKIGRFPKPIKFGRSVRWRLSDLEKNEEGFDHER